MVVAGPPPVVADGVATPAVLLMTGSPDQIVACLKKRGDERLMKVVEVLSGTGAQGWQ